MHLFGRLVRPKGTGLGMHVPKAKCVVTKTPALARWVEEFHVDGFRFDLASALCRDPKGEPMAVPPLIEEIAKDPVLSKVPPFLPHP